MVPCILSSCGYNGLQILDTRRKVNELAPEKMTPVTLRLSHKYFIQQIFVFGDPFF